MGNLSNQIEQLKCKVSLDPAKIESGLVELLSFDLDFTENEEYFSEDTLALGYKNEAERLVKEYLASNSVTDKKRLYDCCEHLLSQVFRSSFYGNWEFDVSETRGKSNFFVHVAYQY